MNAKLVSFAYLQIGIVQASAGFFTYFYMLNDYGFAPMGLFNMIQIKGFYPNHSDIFDPSKPYNGNTNVKCKEGLKNEEVDGITICGKGEADYDNMSPDDLYDFVNTGVLDWNTN